MRACNEVEKNVQNSNKKGITSQVISRKIQMKPPDMLYSHIDAISFTQLIRFFS